MTKTIVKGVDKNRIERLMAICQRIEDTAASLQQMGKKLSASRRKTMKQWVYVEEHMKGCYSAVWSIELYYDDSFPGGTERARVAHEALVAQIGFAKERLSTDLTDLSYLLYNATKGKHTFCPIVDVWGKGSDVRIWLRATHEDARKALDLAYARFDRERHLAHGELFTVASLAIGIDGIGQGTAWNLALTPAKQPTTPCVRAQDCAAALTWMAATMDHAILPLLTFAPLKHGVRVDVSKALA